MRRLIPILLFAVAVWSISCAPDAPTHVRPAARSAAPSHVPVPCDENPSDPSCDPGGGGGGGTVPLPPCTSLATRIQTSSITGAGDTTLAVTMSGPYQVSGCTGPAVWRASAQGTSLPLFFRWYLIQCTGIYNYCGTEYTAFAEGVGLDSILVPLGSNVRSQFTYVEVREATAPNYRSGVSNVQPTRGPAFGPEGGPPFSSACFSNQYPMDRDTRRVDSTFIPPDTIAVDTMTVRRHYDWNVCTAKRQFDTVHVDTIHWHPY